MKNVSTTPCVGRPRSFDPDDALEKAMQVFWRHGYEGTSLSDLTEAMGINRPSLYATFGNKEALFEKVLDRYGAGPASYLEESLKELTTRAVIEKLLKTSACLLGDPSRPGGCMVVQGILCSSKESEAVMQSVRARRVAVQQKILERFRRAQEEGDLPPTVLPEDLARHISIILNGLSIQASNGACREELQKAVDFALKTLPV